VSEHSSALTGERWRLQSGVNDSLWTASDNAADQILDKLARYCTAITQDASPSLYYVPDQV